MKRYITLALIFVASIGMAQTKPDTSHTIKVHMNEAEWILNNLQRAQVKIHRLKMDALDRDTIDSYINSVYILQRRLTVLQDSLKKGGKK